MGWTPNTLHHWDGLEKPVHIGKAESGVAAANDIDFFFRNLSDFQKNSIDHLATARPTGVLGYK